MSAIAFSIFSYLLGGIYILALTVITVYCLLQFELLLRFYRKKDKKYQAMPEMNDYPLVTVQLPIFNEQYVAERLIDQVCALDYPREKLEIQVLDDSTDDTAEITKKKVAEYKQKGFTIHWVHRTDRSGYKAGALQEAMKSATGKFIAIFDADFIPPKDFLKNTIPYFKTPELGVVQARWGHINEDYSLITRMQAFQLNVHFTVEQKGRDYGNYLLQFNGTAGVWRTDTIHDAGGWKADTLTEDLDLSYRAQLKGWDILFKQELIAPAELPAEMIGLKSQQYRWMKGGAETARKLLPAVWRSALPFWTKVMASSHLLGSSVFFFVFILAVISVPVMALHTSDVLDKNIYSVFFIGLIAIATVYFEANVRQSDSDKSLLYRLVKFIILFPVFLALSMGLSLHNTYAVIQGLRGKQSAFIRTPKFAIRNQGDDFKKKRYKAKTKSWMTISEGLLALYFALAFAVGLSTGQDVFLLYHGSLALGFGTICYYSMKHAYS